MVVVFDPDVELDPTDRAGESAFGFVLGDSESDVCSNVHADVSGKMNGWVRFTHPSPTCSPSTSRGRSPLLGEFLAVDGELHADLVLTCGYWGRRLGVGSINAKQVFAVPEQAVLHVDNPTSEHDDHLIQFGNLLRSPHPFHSSGVGDDADILSGHLVEGDVRGPSSSMDSDEIPSTSPVSGAVLIDQLLSTRICTSTFRWYDARRRATRDVSMWLSPCL